MIDRIALLKLKAEHADAAGRAAITRRALEALRPIPGVLAVSAGEPADESSAKSWDVVITIRFASLADADAYREHPEHRRFVDEFVAPRCEVRKAWSFAVEAR
ncbi:MAG: Dabb family protein [Candidatus Binatia bacterium]